MVQISHRPAFVEAAQKVKAIVSIDMHGASVPESTGNGLVRMTSVLQIDYRIEFEDENVGEARYTFRENLRRGEDGLVRLKDCLLQMIKDAGVMHTISGASRLVEVFNAPDGPAYIV